MAWEKWIETPDAKRVLDGAASGTYLCNRLYVAFLDGFTMGMEAMMPVKKVSRKQSGQAVRGSR